MNLLRFFIRQLWNIRRYSQMMRVFIKYGFDDYLAERDKQGRVWFFRKVLFRRRLRRALTMTRGERLRLGCEELGPTFIKFGQVLSTRNDLLPKEIIEELEKLQDNVPAFSASKAHELLQKETGRKVSQIFKKFKDIPVAAASMAQVHKAELFDGRIVAVKIRRPDVLKIVEQDLRIMTDIAELLEARFPTFRPYDPRGLIRYFEESIRLELNFENEAINIRRFKENFLDDPEICSPEVMEEFSSQGILVMEFIEGVKLSNLSAMKRKDIDPKEVAERIANSFFKQLLQDGFFQADPHQGNFIVKEGNVLCYIDFGMMGVLLPKDKKQLVNLIHGLALQDVNQILRAIQELAEIASFKHARQLEYETLDLVNRYAYMPNAHNHMGAVLMELTRILSRYGLKVPSNLFLLIRALFSMEGLVRKLDPDIVVYELIQPYIVASIEADRNPLNFGARVIQSIYNLGDYLEEFPQDLRETMRMIKTGQIKVGFEIKGLDQVQETVTKGIQTIVSTLMCSAILLSSAMLHSAGVEPKWGTVPVISTIGYLIGGFMVFRLLLKNMLRENRRAYGLPR